jgi:hypothetical protein
MTDLAQATIATQPSLPPILRRRAVQQAGLPLAATIALAIGATGVQGSGLTLPAVLLGSAIFAAAGYIKGLTAIGLPTMAVAALSFVVPIPEAMALVALPAIASNAWQAVSGGRFTVLLRRLMPLIAPLCIAAMATVWLLGRSAPGGALTVLGGVLMAYGALGLLRLRPRVKASGEPVLSPVVGVASGFLCGLVGVPIMPVLP